MEEPFITIFIVTFFIFGDLLIMERSSILLNEYIDSATEYNVEPLWSITLKEDC